MFSRVLIANRGEIAVRILRTLKKLGVASCAVYSEPDLDAQHVRLADRAIALPGRTAAETYLNAALILKIARENQVDAIHPGYGFLSENADFAAACEAASVAFIGPTPEQMRRFGLKHAAREIALERQIPLLPGSGLLADTSAARDAAERIGYPVMLKSTAGGGGIGMRLCRDEVELEREFESVRALAANNFKNDGLFLERYVARARHVEVQIFGDGAGRVLALGERDCSVQRRNQKVIEETPAPDLPDAVRAKLADAAISLARAVEYRSAGTVEFVYDAERQSFYFLEVNTRLQVEHGVTENVYGVDLVEWMLRLAAGETEFLNVSLKPQGASIQARLYAENPAKQFQPSAGLLTAVAFPEDARVDAWVESGTEVSPYYDPLLAKVMTTGVNRAEAAAKLEAALKATRLYGIETNRDYLLAILANPEFQAGRVYTRLLDGLEYAPRTMDVLAPGMLTTVQDYPGRLGYWDVGVPPGGPMDALSFQLANRLLGNAPGAPGLEITLAGPTLRFNAPVRFCLGGAQIPATLDGAPVDYWRPILARLGATLKLGVLQGAGARAYLCVAGGLDVASFLGSAATFALGKFGGHGGRALVAGDVLKLAAPAAQPAPADSAAAAPAPEARLIPSITRQWTIGALYGPHGAPDFFTEQDIETFFASDWQVHYNSARTGVRLIGPRPQWARADGGEAGLHPSNIHDNAYAIGAVDFTGDMPIILGPDGPSLGGFVCPATIATAELWKIGQLAPGDTVRFVRISHADALQLLREQSEQIQSLRAADAPRGLAAQSFSALAADAALEFAGQASPVAASPAERVVYRQSGDANLLVEFGENVLDLELRFRVHGLMEWLKLHPLVGVIDLTPGIRSLQIHYDPQKLPRETLLSALRQAQREAPALDEIEVPARIVHLPLSWDDPSTQLATAKYMQSVWAEAPWCPSNLEFIRRINGLESIDAVRRIVFDASYMVLGLGDVYLGAPVATPVDPRHRLVTTKYNPARTWTPENAVGIGGAYLCIYGMEGPGGYQFVGRTCQVWNSYRTTREFEAGAPHLLRFFDQLRFYPVSAEELEQFRRDFPAGRAGLKIEPTVFRLADYRRFLRENAESIGEFKSRQQTAFEAERERWKSIKPPQIEESDPAQHERVAGAPGLAEHVEAVTSPMHGSVWKLLVEVGQQVEEGEDILILEAMKMEVRVQAPVRGRVTDILRAEGAAVSPGQHLMILDARP